MRIARTIAASAALMLVLLVGAAFACWMIVRASLPVIDGTLSLPGLGGPLRIERDAAGVPTISARTREDLARGLGYVHGQDRYFQMDLLRRAAAGELSALLGAPLLPIDRKLRVHQFRSVARVSLSALDARQRTVLDAYVAGVNAGLGSLRSRPFEYWLLRQPPAAWTAEDTILCAHAMYLQLQDAEGHAQLQRGLLRATLPAAAWALLEAGAPEWDSAVDGSQTAEPRLPRADEYDLRRFAELPVFPPHAALEHLGTLGSNNWAVSGTQTATGAALLANDMHLDYRVPNIWYRARQVLEHADVGLDVVGVTLPGTPVTVAGSNGSIAWGFTNSYGEFSTVIRLATVSGDERPTVYRTASGEQRIEYVDEAIAVAGGPTEHLTIGRTPWGPILGRDWEGRPYALQWAAQNPVATNLSLLSLEQTRSVAEALRQAPAFGIPGQNFVVADREGHIGWTIGGRLPRRGPAESGVPQESTDLAVGTDDWLPAADQPRIMDPPGGLLWSANARVVGGTAALLIGDDAMNRGARGAQIHADLQQAPRPVTPAASLAVQLDDRALFLERWRALLGEVIEHARAGARRAGGLQDHAAARDTLRTWSGHAAPTDAAFRLVNRFREEVEARAFFMLIAPARQRAANFDFEIPSSFEGPLWRLVQARPPNLLASRYADWDAFFTGALEAAEVVPPACSDLPSCTWGRVNAVHIEHPLSKAVPLFAPLLDMPVVTVPGARADMPRIQGPDFGASERFSVSPGDEAHGYFHMPGAQSGNPSSPFYRTGFEDWAAGRPTQFLPGPTLHTLTLIP